MDSIDAGRAVVAGARAHHLARVVRLRVGENVDISDGSQAWTAITESVDPHSVVFTTGSPIPPAASTPRLELQLALIKFPRLEWAIQKATELGVSVIVPITAERSDGSLAKAAQKRIERWARMAEEAAQQSRRMGPPTLAKPCDLDAALARPADLRLFLDFSGEPLRQKHVRQIPTDGTVTVLIGPEGGWTAEEIKRAQAAGAIGVVLGPQVLRAETAALAALSIVDQMLRTVE